MMLSRCHSQLAKSAGRPARSQQHNSPSEQQTTRTRGESATALFETTTERGKARKSSDTKHKSNKIRQNILGPQAASLSLCASPLDPLDLRLIAFLYYQLMLQAAKRHLIRVVRSRDPKCQCSSTVSGQRWFSDNNRKEKDALFRALRPKEELKSPEAKASREIRDHTSRVHPQRTKSGKVATFADFFADLGTPKNKDQGDRRKGAVAASQPARIQINPKQTPTEKNFDKGSFFDDVNTIMERKHAKPSFEMSNTLSEGKDRGASPGSANGFTLDKHANSPPTQRSIFDTFPVHKPRSPNAYEEEAFDQYCEVLKQIMDNGKFLRAHTRKPLEGEKAQAVIDWLTSAEPTVECNLPLLDKAIKEGLSDEELSEATDVLRRELKSQQDTFKDHHGWTTEQYRIAIGALRNMGGVCARNASAPPLDIAWQKLKEAGYKMDKESLNNFLYVSSTFSIRSAPSYGSKRGSVLDFLGGGGGYDLPDETEDETEESLKETPDVAAEVALCHDFLFEPSEQSVSIRVRMLVAQGNARAAETLLDENSVSSLFAPCR
jgi:hypothetical protein